MVSVMCFYRNKIFFNNLKNTGRMNLKEVSVRVERNSVVKD